MDDLFLAATHASRILMDVIFTIDIMYHSNLLPLFENTPLQQALLKIYPLDHLNQTHSQPIGYQLASNLISGLELFCNRY